MASKSSSSKRSAAARKAAATRKRNAAAAAAPPADPTEAAALAAQEDARNRADAYDSNYKSGDVHGHAVYDHDARQITQVFNNGDVAQQKEDAAGYMGRLLGKTGEGAERDLSVVKIVEV